MGIFRVTFKGPDDKLVYMSLEADSKEQAVQLAERAQFRRMERFPLTFERLEQAKETGKPGQLAIAPGLGGKALTEAWVKAEIEKRKADQARYEAGFKVFKVEEQK